MHYRSKQGTLNRGIPNGQETLKEKCLTSSAIKEMQIKTTLRFYLTPVRMAKIKKSDNSLYWRGCGIRGTLLQFWWKCKLILLLWKSVRQFLRKKWELIYLKT